MLFSLSAEVVDILLSVEDSDSMETRKDLEPPPKKQIIPAPHKFRCEECFALFQSRFSMLMHIKLIHLKLGK
jgi:hypothetical protein